MRMILVEGALQSGRAEFPGTTELKKSKIYWIAQDEGKNHRIIIYEDVPFIKFLFRKIIKKFKGV